jgi:hypothetical protein
MVVDLSLDLRPTGAGKALSGGVVICKPPARQTAAGAFSPRLPRPLTTASRKGLGARCHGDPMTLLPEAP